MRLYKRNNYMQITKQLQASHKTFYQETIRYKLQKHLLPATKNYKQNNYKPITKQLLANHKTITFKSRNNYMPITKQLYIPITKQLQANQKKIDQETIINSHKIFIDRKFY